MTPATKILRSLTLAFALALGGLSTVACQSRALGTTGAVTGTGTGSIFPNDPIGQDPGTTSNGGGSGIGVGSGIGGGGGIGGGSGYTPLPGIPAWPPVTGAPGGWDWGVGYGSGGTGTGGTGGTGTGTDGGSGVGGGGGSSPVATDPNDCTLVVGTIPVNKANDNVGTATVGQSLFGQPASELTFPLNDPAQEYLGVQVFVRLGDRDRDQAVVGVWSNIINGGNAVYLKNGEYRRLTVTPAAGYRTGYFVATTQPTHNCRVSGTIVF